MSDVCAGIKFTPDTPCPGLTYVAVFAMSHFNLSEQIAWTASKMMVLPAANESCYNPAP